jgi:hypothetical protein
VKGVRTAAAAASPFPVLPCGISSISDTVYLQEELPVVQFTAPSEASSLNKRRYRTEFVKL